jgi:L-ascorbate metabolism protein UlaG (beta-lactamase superfamily)
MADLLTWVGHSTVVVELEGTRVVTDPALRTRLAPGVRVRVLIPGEEIDL